MKRLLLLLFVLCANIGLLAQNSYEPAESEIYRLLSDMSAKGAVEFNDEILPLPRTYLASKILETLKSPLITELDRKELEFYRQDFFYEYQILQGGKENGEEHSLAEKDKGGRLRLFSYSNSVMKIACSPVLGYEIADNDSKKNTHSWSGLSLHGYLGENIGYNFYFRDNKETGDNLDHKKLFSPEQGVIIAKQDGKSFEYSDVRANIGYSWSFGSINLGKDAPVWGYGESGRIVLSGKATSFPFFRLDLQPASWLRFNYIHAWLQSEVADSNASYWSLRQGEHRTVDREKYLASHSLIITPTKGLDIALGESMIYADKLKLAYWIPVLFFRPADHYLSNGNNDAGDNAQFFFSLSSKDQIKGTHLYGNLFIDEITLEGLFDSYKQRNQFGFTLGGKLLDLPLENLSLTAEFTKIFPYVYHHYIPTLTYENQGYCLGHWMGHNSDLVYAAIGYRAIRGMDLSVWIERVRKGGDGVVAMQYEQPQPPFLFGLNQKYTYLGAEIKYQITHELFARANYLFTNSSVEKTKDNFTDQSKHALSCALYYGF